MKKIYSYELYKKRTNKDFYNFIKDYLKFEETSANLDIKLNKTDDFIKMIERHKDNTIAIFGDYDVDGISATSIMYKGLKKYKVKDVLTYIPNRFSDGYGMNERMVKNAFEKGTKLIITVDNGISAFEAIEYAKSLGIDVVVTDHHLPKEEIPRADIIINPHISDQPLKTEHICGAMVAYLLMKSLLPNKELEEEKFIAMTATITDVMPLVHENRTIVKDVIQVIREKGTTYNKGIDALLQNLKISFDTFSAETISFKIGPILNTPGRMYKADLAFELLIENDSDRIQYLIDQILNLNQERKNQLENLKQQLDQSINHNEHVNVAVLEDANEGLIGIVAGSICEKTNRPTFIFTKTPEGMYKASGRSPKWCDLSSISKRIFENIIPVSYGGHTHAMGLTLKDIDDVFKFKQLLSDNIKNMDKEELTTCLRYPDEFSIIELRDILDKFQPYGEGLKEPSFALTIKLPRPFIIANKHMKFNFYINGEKIEALQFYNVTSFKDCYYNVYFKINKDYSVYSKKIEYKFFIEEIEEFKN